MIPVILFRDLEGTDEEFNIASQHLTTVKYRSQCWNSLVVSRFSCLPHYEELRSELKTLHCIMINSYEQHRYLADITEWYRDLQDYTPKTYQHWYGLKEGQYIVKGKTNSKKTLWNTHMFCKSVSEIRQVASRCLDDTLLGEQGLVVREYVPLHQLGEGGINGLPITEEYRTFWAYGEYLSGGFYWSEHPCFDRPVPLEALSFAKEISDIVETRACFYVIDVARTAAGNWILIELNDGQMSGNCTAPLDRLYRKLSQVLSDVCLEYNSGGRI